MSVFHQFVITCDQQPLPNKCLERLVVQADPAVSKLAVALVARDNDWGILKIKGKTCHYCPVHRPTHQPSMEELDITA